MKKREIIKKSKEFTDLITNSKFLKTKEYIIYYKDNNLNKKRFGIAISNKVGNAVTRNKLKRQTREIIDDLKNLFKNNRDYIIMIKKEAKNVDFISRKIHLTNLLKENSK